MNDRDERENSLRFRKHSFAKSHLKGKKYTVVRPKPTEPLQANDDTALNAALETIAGGHHDTVRRNDDFHDRAQVYDTADSERRRQLQKAMYIRQQLVEEESRPYLYDDISDIRDTRVSSYEHEKPAEKTVIDKDRRTDLEKAIMGEYRSRIADPEIIDRMRKAQFIKEQLEKNAAVSAMAAYVDEDIHDENNEIHHDKKEPEPPTFRDDSEVNSILSSMIPVLSDNQKADIQRNIKQRLYENRIEKLKASEPEKTDTPASVQTVYFAEKHNNTDEKDSWKDSVLDDVGTAVGYVQAVHTPDIQKAAIKPVADVVKRSLSGTAQKAIDVASTATQSVSGADSIQAAPYNLGMILAENEAKKIAYKITKDEDVLAERERIRVNERMVQNKYLYIEPDKHTPNVQKSETIREQHKQKYIKDTETRKLEARREAEQKAKENIYLKANRNEQGFIGRIFGEDRKYHPKSSAALIIGAAGAVFPVILILVVIMFICVLFSWTSPHKEKLIDDSGQMQETELTGEEVITGYVSLIQQTYDEKQLEILARITQMNCDHESIDNKWLKLDENFDIESIIAIEATKKWRELQDSMKESEGEEAPEETESHDGEEAEDIIYHITKEDFEEVIDRTYNIDLRTETRVCDQCQGEQQVEYDPVTGEFYIVTTPCVHTFLTGSGVNDLVSIAGHENLEYYFFDLVFDKDSETYEEDKMMYDLYREVLQKNILGTTDEPSHTIVDYSGYSEDYQRMLRNADALGYEVGADGSVRKKE